MEASEYVVTGKGQCLFPDEEDRACFEITCQGKTALIIQASHRGQVFFQSDIHADAELGFTEPLITPEGVAYLSVHEESGGSSLSCVFFDPESRTLKSQVLVQALADQDTVLVLWSERRVFWVLDDKPQAMPFDKVVGESKAT